MDEDNKCQICDNEYGGEPERIRKRLECGHEMCRSCLLDIFKRDTKCPYCRRVYVILIKPLERVDESSIPNSLEQQQSIHVLHPFQRPRSRLESIALVRFVSMHFEIATEIFELYNVQVVIGDHRLLVNKLSVTLLISLLALLTIIVIFS